ncbi:MAG: hypothetical protein KatS3mg076_1378 [Candidatus Binatia bacterium]|nr:MAG: hypothetical protein KatS3mg076_1378 [Candidatus Binatia bacterium]
MHKRPRRLRIHIGGFLGPSWSVELVRGKLHCRSSPLRYADWKTEVVTVTDEQWAAFRSALDALGVWQWRPEYPNPGVCDGTGWSIDIAYADRKIRSHGDNNYPRRDGSPNNEPTQTETFAEFCRAVRSLLGGRDFH